MHSRTHLRSSLECKRKPSDHEQHVIRGACNPLIDLSQQVTVLASLGKRRNNPAAHFIRDQRDRTRRRAQRGVKPSQAFFNGDQIPVFGIEEIRRVQR